MSILRFHENGFQIPRETTNQIHRLEFMNSRIFTVELIFLGTISYSIEEKYWSFKLKCKRGKNFNDPGTGNATHELSVRLPETRFSSEMVSGMKKHGEQAKRKCKVDTLDWNEMYKINIVPFIDSSCRAHCWPSPFLLGGVKNIVFAILAQIIVALS